MKQGCQRSMDGSIATADGQDLHLLRSHAYKGAGYVFWLHNQSVNRRLVPVQDA